MIPFYIYYSMFGFQRVHDLAWAAGDARARGFLLGATSGRTTLNGEGLQHQDGHSHLLAQTIPNCRSYDPCFDYELVTIIKNGINDMYVKNNDNYYYLTLMNENYLHPERPKNLKDSEIMQGAYLFNTVKKADVRILASGLTLRFALEASKKLMDFDVKADIWSITSFNELARGGMIADQKNMNEQITKSYVECCFETAIPTVAVSEYQKLYAEQIRKWVNGNYICLGTDGFGRSDTREKLREYFEIDSNHIAYNALLACGFNKEAKRFKNKYKVKLNKDNPYTR
jgi:pyruvate dehydrogenase E1 component